MSHAGNILSKVHKLGIGKYVICRPTATTEWTEMLVVGHIGNQAVVLYNPSEEVKGIVMKELFDEVIEVGKRGGVPRLGHAHVLHRFTADQRATIERKLP